MRFGPDVAGTLTGRVGGTLRIVRVWPVEIYSRSAFRQPSGGLHEACARRLITLSGRARDATFTWVDVGAGGGEIARTLAEHFPDRTAWRSIFTIVRPISSTARGMWNGGALTSHATYLRPTLLQGVIWSLRSVYGTRPPSGYLCAQHVGDAQSSRHPLPGGPELRKFGQPADGPALAVFLPGEHLCMPTPKGARLCLLRELANIAGHDGSAVVSTQTILSATACASRWPSSCRGWQGSCPRASTRTSRAAQWRVS